MTVRAGVACGVAALTIAGTALAAGETISKKGLVYATTAGKSPVLRAEPKADAPEVAHPPNGARLRYVEVVGPEDKPAWYHVDQIGMARGWLAGDLARVDAPIKPPTPPIAHIDLGSIGAKTATVLTAAARGLDARVLSYGAEPAREDALQQLADLRSAIDHQMADVPYDGHDGKHKPGARFDHTADGRKRDAQRFHDELAAEGGAK